MVRYWISEWTGTAEGLDMAQEIVPTFFNVICLALISSFTLTGSILAVYYDRKGTVLLFLSQIASIVFAVVYFSVPLASHTVNEYCNYDASLDSNAFYGIFIWVTCLFKCFGYFLPIFMVLWFIYCTIAIGIVLSGHHVFANQPNFNRTGFELISTDEQEEILA
ncbi:hypothetical protein CAEBREN_16768 [Caenorhabditis brenneri]|uniref:Uncharacterized protein n=1 Tax=Caenorhabditis brenneri TaxID=135651 RepID=G0N491_CAEBE|nr:hypothetical protein CAEBREN_16768 [Caenorhabditis brenneri]